MIGYSAGGRFQEILRSHNRVAPKIPSSPYGVGMVVRSLGTTQELPDLPAPSETSTPPRYFDLEAQADRACTRLCSQGQTLTFLDGLKAHTEALSFLVGPDDATFLSNYARGIERIQVRLGDPGAPPSDEDRGATCKAITEVWFMAATEVGRPGVAQLLGELEQSILALSSRPTCSPARKKITGTMMLGGGLALMALGAMLMKGKRKS